MTHFWIEGDPLVVTLNLDGEPKQLIWRGETHIVVEVANRWIVDEEWWLERIWRDYYKVATDTYLLLTVFCDLNSEKWFVQRLYD